MRKRTVCLFLLGLMMSSVCVPGVGDANTSVPSIDNGVRVALFMKSPKYTALAAAVTLSSADRTMTLQDDLQNVWETLSMNSRLRIGLDGYRVQLLSTTQMAMAKSLYDTVRSKKYPCVVYADVRNGVPQYTVSVGPFAEGQQAENIRNTLNNDETIRLALAKQTAKVVGPFYASLGTYASEEAAKNSAIPLWNAGMSAVIAQTGEDIRLGTYNVWIGGATETERAQLLVQAKAIMPEASGTTIPVQSRYVLRRYDHSSENGWTDGVRRWELSPNVALTATTTDGTILVNERMGRTYRGAIQLFAYNGELAVINVVPLEQYVASVVGSELDASWPIEALKAQAVAARTYVLKQGNKYDIAHVTDTTFDQVYFGIQREFPNTVTVAQQTNGQRLVRTNGSLQDAFYHSNAGNWTSEAKEVWNTEVPGIVAVPSPDDIAQKGKPLWFRIVSATGKVGYVRSDLLQREDPASQSEIVQAEVTASVANMRAAPFINNETNAPLDNLKGGERVTIIGQAYESSSYQWVRGPIRADALMRLMQGSNVATKDVSAIGSTLTQLSISMRSAQTGRVTLLAANGKPLLPLRSDQYRTLLQLPSTRFEIESTAQLTILGQKNRTETVDTIQALPRATILGSKNNVSTFSTEGMLVVDATEHVRVVTQDIAFRFHGYGFGHGLGMSQWGAYSLATLGYTYRDILQYYFPDAQIAGSSTTTP